MRRELSEDSSVSGSESFISRILFFLAASSATKVDSLTVLCKDIAHLVQHITTLLLFCQGFTEVIEVLSGPPPLLFLLPLFWDAMESQQLMRSSGPATHNKTF